MSNPYLEVRGLKKSFGLKPVLRGVDLALNKGERMALLGANGAGKTTLLRILACLTKPGGGSACVASYDIQEDAQAVRHLIGFIGHQSYLYDDLTVIENLHFFGQLYTVRHIQERALTLLHKVGMEKRKNERVSALSRGQVQRVSLARAFLHSPTLLLLDEPETGLDQQGNEVLENLLTEFTAQGGTTLFTTHQFERALASSDTISMLSKGRIVYQQKSIGLALDELRQAYQEVVE